MTIVKHDFGGPKRTAARRLRRQLTLDAMHEDNVRENPLPYLERASERIFQLESALFEANRVGKESAATPREFKPVTVGAQEYVQLLKCRILVEDAFSRLVAQHEDEEATQLEGENA